MSRHRRRAKGTKDLSRRKAKRDQYDKVLIVCEGEKTEPNYFEGLREYYRLNIANVAVTGDCGSSPMCVVRHAKNLYKQECAMGDPFDRVYCVIDKDQHPDYNNALNTINSLSPKGVFYAAYSVPCFEYWLILHFTYTTAPYSSVGNKSAGDFVLEELRSHLLNYEKGAKSVFENLQSRLSTAMINATNSLNQAAANGTDNPSTKVHELVDYLQNLK